jgi:molecular chaperone GrpE
LDFNHLFEIWNLIFEIMSDQDSNQVDNNSDQLQKDLEEAIKQAQANLDGWKRTAADFENYKKRKEAENKDLLEFAKEVTVAKLLPTIDSLEQGLRHMPEVGLIGKSSFAKASADETSESRKPNFENLDGEFLKKYQNWQKGIECLLAQLDKALAEMGVKKIEALGKKFDPHFHEAVREIENDQEDGTVVEEFQSGFILNGKVIRPSQVVISKKTAKGGE